MYYNHLLDDRSGLDEAVNILEYCCYRVEHDRKAKNQNFDIYLIKSETNKNNKKWGSKK
jgi:hypothetical protein